MAQRGDRGKLDLCWYLCSSVRYEWWRVGVIAGIHVEENLLIPIETKCNETNLTNDRLLLNAPGASAQCTGFEGGTEDNER